ncbi:MAG TPA: ABC transporter permease [Clostridiales bacterium]|nr:ABC transporter permease [Clostridiales bacterium]
MKCIFRLISGELKRLINYKILPVSLATSVIWIIIFLLISENDAKYIAPLLIYVDVTMMEMIFIGASFHFEKQESTIKSMMVLPVSLGEILSAKVIAAMVLGFESAIITLAASFFIHGITFNYLMLAIFVIIAGITHGAIGFFLALISKDFTTMLGWMMAYMLPFALPTILFMFEIIDKKYDWMLMVSPSHSASELITSAVTGKYEAGKAIFACVYLIIVSIILLRYVIYPKFKDNSVRG